MIYLPSYAKEFSIESFWTVLAETEKKFLNKGSKFQNIVCYVLLAYFRFCSTLPYEVYSTILFVRVEKCVMRRLLSQYCQWKLVK